MEKKVKMHFIKIILYHVCGLLDKPSVAMTVHRIQEGCCRLRLLFFEVHYIERDRQSLTLFITNNYKIPKILYFK